MASVTSLGVHKPSALPFLVAEGILPPDPPEDAFTWHAIEGDVSTDGGEDEELLSTDRCVVWSKGGVIQRLFRFDIEGESIQHAVFTHFPNHSTSDVRSSRPGPSYVQSQNRTTNGGSKVPKQRASGSKAKSNKNDDATLEERNYVSSEHYRSDSSRSGRALVVVLKTQAHVFFVSETSHIVHLPFEVDAVFPSIHGILLQRKLPEQVAPPSTPQLPSAPNNSFAFSQGLSSSGSPSSSRPLAYVSSSNDSSSPILPLLKGLLERSNLTPKDKLPRVFCLTDPLADIGTVAVKRGSNVTNTQGTKAHGTSSFGNLDPKETVLYVSPQDEICQEGLPARSKGPLSLVVTENRGTGNLSVWTMTYVDYGTSKAMQRQSATSAGGTISRRRSSFAPGMGTGTTTPVAKGTADGRENFVGSMSRLHTGSDPTTDEVSTQNQDDLLNSAFVDSTLPAKNLRRVSGLLARSDLSANHDRNTFSDPKGIHAGSKKGRKGASFGPNTSRLSVGPDTSSGITKPHNLHGIRTSLDSVSLYEPQLDDLADELDDIHDLRNLAEPGLHPAVGGLRKEAILAKIYALPGEGPKRHLPAATRGNPTRQIFTMKSPKTSLGESPDKTTMTMFLLDRVACELLVLQISVEFLSFPHRPKTDGLEATPMMHRTRVTGMTRRSGVVDACKVGDGVCSRFLVLESSGGGIGELSLQSPWSSQRKFNLPAKLYLHNPYQITQEFPSQQNREGGFKRVISRGPQSLLAVQHSHSQARFDVLDSDNVRHRLQLQLRPRNPLVQKIIKASESILPSTATDGEVMLRGWWETMSWLEARSETESDIEWSAVVVLLFSMGVGFIDDRRTETVARQKKKKGGLLRSSSGANTDLDSWEAMMGQEATISGVLPAWMKAGAWEWTAREKVFPTLSKRSKSSNSFSPATADAVPIPKKNTFIIHCISVAREFMSSPNGQSASGDHGYLPTASSRDADVRRTALASLLVGLQLLREELKLDILAAAPLHQLTPVLAQIGTWLGWEAWGNSGSYMLENEDMDSWLLEDSLITSLKVPPEPFPPTSIMQFIESANLDANPSPMLSLVDVARSPGTGNGLKGSSSRLLKALTPRTMAVTSLMQHDGGVLEDQVSKMVSWGLRLSFLESLPEGIAAPFRAAIASCQARPSTAWNTANLNLVGREDIAVLQRDGVSLRPLGKSQSIPSNEAIRDVHSICHSVLEVETVGPYDGSAELDRQSITRLLFKEDQRFLEAAKLVHPLQYPVAQCNPEADWSDTDLLEAQQELAKVIAVRTLSVSPGRGLLFYSGRLPLLTEKFPIHGFTLSCIMKPADTTVTADRTQFTEDKVSWAFFHAGVEAGLSISKTAKGIDTSWILFNKPKDLTNRHAGLLLALGLNGHLTSIAKWVAFKYLTPKHTMSSIGLLLGLSASYLGTMDTLVTRLLSVHVTRMLPPGAAELNLSPLTQTSGIMGIGLLYCNTQHRRMSEIMLSEMENIDQDDTSNPLDNLRDEGYRLAAGFALGYINLGLGKDLKGLHDMHIVERLLILAISTRKVSIVHTLDKASAAATVAIALIFMKTGDETLARKINIPDTVHQFDYVRPDMFLLRTVARNLIMWDQIQANSKWMSLQLPLSYQHKSGLTTVRILTSEDMPFFNIVTGLCLSIGLKFAGSGALDVRNLLCHYLDQFMRICKMSSPSYDSKLSRLTVRNCQDVVAIAVCCVMAGTGDLHIFRRLRSLHGRTDADTPYGSHLATHFAIGVLFMGGGTHTLGTSNIAVASLLCAFYPLFPNTVLDNKPHLQAFRHFWVLASENRCLVPRDVDTRRPVTLPILVTLLDGTESAMSAPCLLPELDTIAKIQTNDPKYWSVTLDIANNPSHRAAFARHQSIHVRRRAAYDAHTSIFSATMQALNDAQSAPQMHKQVFRWIFTLPTFSGFDRAEQALVLPAETGSSVYKGTRGTVVDDRLVLERVCLESTRAERLWNLRILFAWADGLSRRGDEWSWLGKEVVEGLKAGMAMRRWRSKG